MLTQDKDIFQDLFTVYKGLFSIVETLILKQGKLPESQFYYFLRDEIANIIVLLKSQLSDDMNHKGIERPQLSLAFNFIKYVSETGLKFLDGFYLKQANNALLLNLQTLQKLGKVNEIKSKLEQIPWAKEALKDDDDLTITQIKEFAKTFNDSNFPNSQTYISGSTATLLNNLNATEIGKRENAQKQNQIDTDTNNTMNKTPSSAFSINKVITYLGDHLTTFSKDAFRIMSDSDLETEDDEYNIFKPSV